MKFVPHHPPLLLMLNNNELVTLTETVESVYYDFNKADYESISNVLHSIDWYSILDHENVEGATQTFSNVLSYVIDRHVPKKAAKTSEHAPWQSRESRRLKREKSSPTKLF